GGLDDRRRRPGGPGAPGAGGRPRPGLAVATPRTRRAPAPARRGHRRHVCLVATAHVTTPRYSGRKLRPPPAGGASSDFDAEPAGSTRRYGGGFLSGRRGADQGWGFGSPARTPPVARPPAPPLRPPGPAEPRVRALEPPHPQ